MSRFWFGAWGKGGSSIFADGYLASQMNGGDSLDISAASRAIRVLGEAALKAQSALPPETYYTTRGDDSPILAAPLQAVVPMPFGLTPAMSGITAAGAEPQAFIGALLTDAAGASIAMLFSDPRGGGGGALLYDVQTQTILTEGADIVGLGEGHDDQMVIGGNIDGLGLDPTTDYLESLVFLGGSNYALATADSNVAHGHSLTVSGTALGAGDSLTFDGSAEHDGSFVFQGGAGGDRFTGGDGADTIYGLGGADWLVGGAGADRFVYTAASESTGAHYDTLADFHFGSDVIDLPVAVSGLDKAVSHGTLSSASFDADLSAALGASALGAGHAVLFTADHGGLAGETFLVVDGNGQAGYQAGEDYVFHLLTPPPADLSNPGFLV